MGSILKKLDTFSGLAVKKYKDKIKKFIETCLEYDIKKPHTITAAELYKQYVLYCLNNPQRILTKKIFFKTFWKCIVENGWKVERIVSKGKVIYLWLRFKTQYDTNIDISKLVKKKDYDYRYPFLILDYCFFCSKQTITSKTLNGREICDNCINKIQKILNG